MRNSPKTRIRILCFALSFLLIFPLVQPALAVAEETGQATVSTVPVYRSASSDSLIIGQVADGMSVKVVARTGAFYEIDCDPMTGFLPVSNIHYSPDVGYVVTCIPEDSNAGTVSQYIPSEAFSLRASLLETGNSLLGTPYVYGGSSPMGFDCSGFVSYLFRQHGFSLHRCADEQMQDGLIVSREDLQAGDLVFFSIYGPWLASHVGIYVGDNQMIHAGSQGITYASLDSEYWANSYVGGRRLISINTAWETLENQFMAASLLNTKLRGHIIPSLHSSRENLIP